MSDLEYQARFAAQAVERILHQVDPDPLSPTYGCAHLAYWRDKTSPVADMRRQEAMLPLAWLYRRGYPGNRWKGDESLRAGVAALLSFWCRGMYADGSLDEWYKGERAFAAAAFSSFAVARTLEVLEDDLPPALSALARRRLARSAAWLTQHDDLFKTNHQAVGTAALAWAAKVLRDDSLREAARAKMASVLAVQTSEGWFPEIGFMDPGYTFLTVEYLAMTMDLWDDWSDVEALCRAFDFACNLVHPDLTLGEEYGSCHNPYLSRTAAVLLSPFSGRAAWLRRRLEQTPVGFPGLASTLADDLRLLRWAWQPLAAFDYARNIPPEETAPPQDLPLAKGAPGLFQTWPRCGISVFSCEQATGIMCAPAGGLLRLFGREPGTNLADLGYALSLDGGWASSFCYDPRLGFAESGKELRIETSLARVKKILPPYWARVGLHLACCTAWGSKAARRAIDLVRARKGTALNQSSSSLGGEHSPWTLQRRLEVGMREILLHDRIRARIPQRRANLYFLKTRDHGWPELCPVFPDTKDTATFNDIQIVRCYRPGEVWCEKLVSLKVE